MNKCGRFIMASFTLIAMSACVATAPVPPPRGYIVSGPPPVPIAEARPAPSDPNTVWVNGYWHWTGMRYTWIPGHWEHPPLGATWMAPRYGNVEGSYFYEPGGWNSAPNVIRPRNANALH